MITYLNPLLKLVKVKNLLLLSLNFFHFKTFLGNVIEVLTQFKHDRFVNYLAKAGLAEDMKENGPYTIFVPSPSVFAQEGITEYFDSLSDEELTSLLLNHIVSGNMAVSEIEDGAVVNSVHGAELKFGVDPDDGHKFIGVEDGVAIIEDSDYQADNGLIHVTDWILFLPESGTESSSSWHISKDDI